ncbi:hypothetical protein [Candidatus Tisiphia endosymbiont of Dascillus cervinus]
MTTKNTPIESQPIISKLSHNQINKIDCLIKNFYDLSLTIQRIISR